MTSGRIRRDDPHAAAIAHLRAADERLAALIAEVGPCTMHAPRAVGPFRVDDKLAALVEAIVSQQLSVKASDTIFGRVCALGPARFPTAGELLAIPEETLRAAGLSRAKASSVRDLCERVHTGALVLETLESLDDDGIVEALSAVRGIGRWTAEMFLMFRLGRPDVLPVGDLGVQKGMQRLYRMRALPTPERMEKVARAWRPHRSIACWYLWRLNERPVDKSKTRPARA